MFIRDKLIKFGCKYLVLSSGDSYPYKFATYSRACKTRTLASFGPQIASALFCSDIKTLIYFNVTDL